MNHSSKHGEDADGPSDQKNKHEIHERFNMATVTLQRVGFGPTREPL